MSAVHCYKKGDSVAKHRRDQIRKEVISEIFHHLNQNLFKQCRCAICIQFRRSFDGIIRDMTNGRMTRRRMERGISFDDWPLEAQRLIEEAERSQMITGEDLAIVVNT